MTKADHFGSSIIRVKVYKTLLPPVHNVYVIFIIHGRYFPILYDDSIESVGDYEVVIDIVYVYN